MIRVELVDPEHLPENLAGIAVHRPGDVTFLLREDLSARQAADAISSLGAHITREAVDATVHRSQAAT